MSDINFIYFLFVFLSNILRTTAKNIKNLVIPGNILKKNPKFMQVSVKNNSNFDFFSYLVPPPSEFCQSLCS